MSRAVRSLLTAATALAGLVPCAQAQSIFDSELRLAPQYQQYRIKAPANETISQLAIPVFVTMPFGSRFTMDVGTSYTHSAVRSDAVDSRISGLTDTQLRGNMTLGGDFIVLTLGLNLPTGRRSVTLDEFSAASRIGSDFLAFPISNMGTGFAATGGIAVARPVGDWALGFGAALRRSQEYEPFNIPSQTLAFRPGNEYRVRAGADRAVGDGRLSLGLTYSAFGQDDAGGSRYSVGDRIITQGAYSRPVNGVEVAVGAYDVYRTSGHYASGDPSGVDNIIDLFGSAGFRPGGRLLEPSLELRQWHQEIGTTDAASGLVSWRTQSSVLTTLGVRTRVDFGGVTAFPSVGYTLGSLATPDRSGAPTHAGLTGFRAQVAMRVSPFAQ
jgi:hypothetical protein